MHAVPPQKQPLRRCWQKLTGRGWPRTRACRLERRAEESPLGRRVTGRRRRIISAPSTADGRSALPRGSIAPSWDAGSAVPRRHAATDGPRLQRSRRSGTRDHGADWRKATRPAGRSQWESSICDDVKSIHLRDVKGETDAEFSNAETSEQMISDSKMESFLRYCN